MKNSELQEKLKAVNGEGEIEILITRDLSWAELMIGNKCIHRFGGGVAVSEPPATDGDMLERAERFLIEQGGLIRYGSDLAQFVASELQRISPEADGDLLERAKEYVNTMILGDSLPDLIKFVAEFAAAENADLRAQLAAVEATNAAMETAIRAVLRYIGSNQVYDKDARGILTRALSEKGSEILTRLKEMETREVEVLRLAKEIDWAYRIERDGLVADGIDQLLQLLDRHPEPKEKTMSIRDEIFQAIRDERERQIGVEGWTPEHDDEHDLGEMAMAAACYAYPQIIRYVEDDKKQWSSAWPWDNKWDKREIHDQKRRLIIAGALIIAELERLERMEKNNVD